MKALIIIAVIVIISRSIRAGKRKSKPVRTAGKKSTVIRIKLPDPERVRKEQARIAKRQFETECSQEELIHLMQVKKDLLTAYERSGCIDTDTEKAINKRIAYDNKLRNVERKINKAQYTIKTNMDR